MNDKLKKDHKSFCEMTGAGYDSRQSAKIVEGLDVSENLLYNWIRKYTLDGEKTKYAIIEDNK